MQVSKKEPSSILDMDWIVVIKMREKFVTENERLLFEQTKEEC